MDPVCYVYHIYITTLIEKYELGIAEDMNGKMHFWLVDPPYNIRRV